MTKWRKEKSVNAPVFLSKPDNTAICCIKSYAPIWDRKRSCSAPIFNIKKKRALLSQDEHQLVLPPFLSNYRYWRLECLTWRISHVVLPIEHIPMQIYAAAVKCLQNQQYTSLFSLSLKLSERYCYRKLIHLSYPLIIQSPRYSNFSWQV